LAVADTTLELLDELTELDETLLGASDELEELIVLEELLSTGVELIGVSLPPPPPPPQATRGKAKRARSSLTLKGVNRVAS
jgi:hypothetical protein